MDIEILMSTMNKNSIEDLKITDKKIESNILIVNQTSNFNKFKKDNIRMYNYNESGLSKSRNRLLENARGDICLIADDDNFYVNNYQEILLNAYQKYAEADIITFQAIKPSGELFKEYYKKPMSHNWRTLLGVSSWEITFKRHSIINSGVQFDKRFGLGSKYPVSEEAIFLMDCYKKGLNIMYIPIPIVGHPNEVTTGGKYEYELMKAKGAVFNRLFGWNSLLLLFIFAFKQYKYYKSDYNFFEAIKFFYSGFFDFQLYSSK